MDKKSSEISGHSLWDRVESGQHSTLYRPAHLSKGKASSYIISMILQIY